MGEWYVYIVECSDGTLYTGATTDVSRRVRHHNHPTAGAKYTRTRQPVRLVYSEQRGGKPDALKRERAIKKLSRSEKQKLIAEHTTRRFHAEAREILKKRAKRFP